MEDIYKKLNKARQLIASIPCKTPAEGIYQCKILNHLYLWSELEHNTELIKSMSMCEPFEKAAKEINKVMAKTLAGEFP